MWKNGWWSSLGRSIVFLFIYFFFWVPLRLFNDLCVELIVLRQCDEDREMKRWRDCVGFLFRCNRVTFCCSSLLFDYWILRFRCVLFNWFGFGCVNSRDIIDNQIVIERLRLRVLHKVCNSNNNSCEYWFIHEELQNRFLIILVRRILSIVCWF